MNQLLLDDDFPLTIDDTDEDLAELLSIMTERAYRSPADLAYLIEMEAEA